MSAEEPVQVAKDMVDTGLAELFVTSQPVAAVLRAVTAALLPAGVEMVMPGDNVSLDVELITPIAIEKESRFAIREGGHTVGAGVVTEVIA